MTTTTEERTVNLHPMDEHNQRPEAPFETRVFQAIAEKLDIRIGLLHDAHRLTVTPSEIHALYGEQQVDLIVATNMMPGRRRTGHMTPFDTWCPERDHNVTLWLNSLPACETGLDNIDLPTWSMPSIIGHASNGEETTACGYIADRILYMPANISGENRTNLDLALWVDRLTDAFRDAIDPNFMDEHTTARRLVAVESIAGAVTSQHRGRLESLRGSIAIAQANAIQSHRDVDTYENELKDLKPQYEAVRSARVDPTMTDPDHLLSLVEKIEALPLVDTITTNPNDTGCLIVNTKMINASVQMGDGERFDSNIGCFALRLDFINVLIRAKNTTRTFSGYDHPHISEGEFCLGASRNLVYSLMKDLQFDVAIEVLLDQLTTVNPDDCYWGEWYEFFDGQLDNYFTRPDYCTCDVEDCDEDHENF